MNQKALIIIPAHNESAIIQKTIKETQKAVEKFKKIDFEILLVDDCSTDDTAKKAKATGVSVISLKINLGIGGAVQTGYKYAKKNKYEYAIQLDGDGQHDPNEIKKTLLPILRKQYDFIIGSRFVRRTDYKPPWHLKLGMLWSTFVLYIATGKKIMDTTSGFRAVNRKGINLFSEDYLHRFAGIPSIVTAHKNGLRIREVSCNFRHRTSGKSSLSFSKLFFYPIKTFLAIFEAMIKEKRRI